MLLFPQLDKKNDSQQTADGCTADIAAVSKARDTETGRYLIQDVLLVVKGKCVLVAHKMRASCMNNNHDKKHCLMNTSLKTAHHYLL